MELKTIPSNVTVVRATNLSQFRPIQILANYVPIITSAASTMQMYRVDFEPAIESADLMKELFRSTARKLFERLPSYDGVHECRSRQKLPNTVTSEEVSSEFGGQTKTYRVTFTHTGVVSVSNELLRFYNTELKSLLQMKLGYFQPQPGLLVHPDASKQVGQDLRIFGGFRTAASIHDGGKILMNFEGAHKLVQVRSVRDVILDVWQRTKARNGDAQAAVRSEMTGKLVVTNYKYRAYRVEDVDFESSPLSSFTMKDGTVITFADYIKNTQNIHVRDLKQPLLTVVPNNVRRRGDEEQSKEAKLIPELCNIAGLTEQQRTDNRLKTDLIRASQISPQERVVQLRSFLGRFHADPQIQTSLKEWGYNYEKDGLKLTAHQIAPTKLTLTPEQAGGIRELTQAHPETADFKVESLAKPMKIQKMVIITPQSELRQKQQITSTLRSGFDRVRLVVEKVEEIDLDGDSPANFARAIKQLHPTTTVAMVIMRNQNKAIYDVIKKAATTELGLVSQVVTSRLMCDERKARSAAVKIAIQIAAKVGGEPWWTDIPLKGTMICGYDTYHDTANRGRSFGAFLASMNEHFSKWYSNADQHDRLDEMSTQIAMNILTALNHYKDVNKKLPEKVIIYRDGVGEGQIEHVFKTELLAIKEKILSVDKGIRLTMILVNKRIGARFYMRTQGDQFINPPPGTVVDHSVTRPERFDFYLISQSTRNGTITPTYYNIIHDESGFVPAAEIHQKLAYKLCLMYYNWAGSVRVPAPCQYAHKLALLCGEHLHAQPNANLRDRLHFL